MISTPCSPSYEYRPTSFTAGDDKCSAPLYAEHRSRLFAGNTFFRSKDQGPDENLIAVECVDTPIPVFNVYNDGVLVETYSVSIGTSGSIAALRVAVSANTNSIIEMKELNVDIYDDREEELDAEDIENPGGTYGLQAFGILNLAGGTGGPTTDAGLAGIRTGPERSVFILSTTEDDTGRDVTPPPTKRVQQWNGEEWISYCNAVPGECPKEGTC